MKNFTSPKISPVWVDTRDFSWYKKTYYWLFVRRKWVFDEDWIFFLPDGTEILIPEKFEFDGASIPRIFSNLISPTGFLFIASIIHDFGYSFGYLIDKNRAIISKYYKRKHFDNLLKDISIDTTGYKFLSNIVYLIISPCGFIAWNNHRKEERKNG